MGGKKKRRLFFEGTLLLLRISLVQVAVEAWGERRQRGPGIDV